MVRSDRVVHDRFVTSGERDGHQRLGDASTAAVRHVLARASTDRAQVVIVVGARGSGKSCLLDVARRAAEETGHLVLIAHGAPDGRASQLGAVIELIAGRPDLPAGLDAVARGTGARDVAVLRVELLRYLQHLCADQRVCVVIDDLDLMDRESIEMFTFALNRLDREPLAAFVSSRRRPGWSRATSWMVDPLSEEQLVGELVRRGVAAEPARACAHAARGLPGMAIALAEGLTAAQRAGVAALPALVRPPRSLLEQPSQFLASLPAEMQRALVVVAADEGGNVVAIRRALAHLGEDPTLVEAAEAHGLLEVDGPVVRFVDPWWRPAAYHLVAPASRRAAHRALAIAYDAPHHAVARAWQLAAAETGRNDEVADALGLIGLDTARRSSVRSAAAILDRAIDFAATPEVRERLQLDALEVALDGLELDRARELAGRIEPRSAETAIAVVETLELCGLPVTTSESCDADEPWARRRRERVAIEDAARGGRLVDRRSTGGGVAGTVRHLIARAQWFRHAARLAEARRSLLHAESLLTPSCRELAATVHVLQADLDQLAGRLDDGERRLELARPTAAWTRAMVEYVASRCDAARHPSSAPPWAARAGVDVASDPLATVRSRVARASRLRDAVGLDELAVQADDLGLPIEACEATLASMEASIQAGGWIGASAHRALVDRLWGHGVHAWDRRIEALEGAIEPSSARDVSCLSQAERRVAEAVGSGMTNREAAAGLFLSVKTVDFHLQQIYRKLDLRSRTELAVVMSAQRIELRRVASR